MSRKRYRPEQIIHKLHKAEDLINRGWPIGPETVAPLAPKIILYNN